MKITSKLQTAVKSVRMPENAKERLAEKIDSLPTEGVVWQADVARPPVLRYAFTSLAACAVLALTGVGIYRIGNAKPPLQPGESADSAACKVPVYTPFGDILETTPLFTYPDPELTAQMREQTGEETAEIGQERTLSTECLQALAEAFRVYGWREMSNSVSPETTETSDCIVMHLFADPANRGSEYLTAYFQMDDDLPQRLVRVDTADGTRWFALQEDLISCLRQIVLEQQPAVYTPPERRFSDVTRRIQSAEQDGKALSLTDGQEAAFATLLNQATLYEWNTLRELDPCHGSCITVQLMSNEGIETLTLWTETGCLQYERGQSFQEEGDDFAAASSVKSCMRYWIDEGAFMEQAERLLVDGILPFPPLGDLTRETITCFKDPLTDEQKQAVQDILNQTEWHEQECTVALELLPYHAPVQLHAGAQSLNLYPDLSLAEWIEPRENAVTVAEDGTEEHSIHHFLTLTQETADALTDAVGQVDHATEAFTPASDYQPFVDLRLYSSIVAFSNQGDGIVVDDMVFLLPERNQRFTADVGRVQDIFSTLDWTPYTPGEYDHLVNGIRMETSDGTLLISSEPFAEGRYLMLWQPYAETQIQILQYYILPADAAEELFTVLSETAAPITATCGTMAESTILTAARRWVTENVPDEQDTITNWEAPAITQLSERPKNAIYLSDTYLTDVPIYKVVFTTTQDALLGTLNLYLYDDGTVFAVDPRE